MVRFVVSNHAKGRMVLRGISMKMIKNTVLKSEYNGLGYLDRSLAFKTFQKGLLKVVYSKEKDIYYIVSVIWEKINIK